MAVGCIEPDDNVTEPALNITSDEVANETLVSNGNEIFRKIDYNISTVRSFYWLENNYETVITNPENFKKSAANGTVNLSLMGEDFEIEVQEIPIPDKGATINVKGELPIHVSYSPNKSIFNGEVVGVTNSNAWFIAGGFYIIGDVDIGQKVYRIRNAKTRPDGELITVIYRSEYQPGELEFTVIPEKGKVKEGEIFKIHLTLTNTGNNTINVWKMYEQISYDIFFSKPDGSKVSYDCGVFSREPLTNKDLVELNPGESISSTFDSRCWNLGKGEYILSAEYHTSGSEHISEPYWLGEVHSKKVLITVE